MHLTSLATAACLAAYVSCAAVIQNPSRLPDRKRQGPLAGLGLVDTETTLPTPTSIIIPTLLVPHDSSTSTTSPLSPDLGDFLSRASLSLTTGSSSASSTVSLTSTSTPSRTHTSSSTTKLAAVLPTPPATSAFSLSIYPTASDMTSLKLAVTPSSTSAGVPASAISANSVWKTVGVSVSVITLIGLTILLVLFYEQWTAFVRDVFLCRHSHRNQDPLGDEDFLPDKHYETSIGGPNRKWAREIRESARLSNIRYPTDVFYGNGSTLGPGKAGIGAGGGSAFAAGEFGQLNRPSRPSFLQRLSMLSHRASSSASPRLGTKSLSPGVGRTGDQFTASTLSPPKMSTF
ncbi:hypothetical protein BJ322DRAFT_740889 [Thelephora terrestris]|uniref:Uncharacterized protein n=1 Tax=Thelephora terrestris TaxID=56493 RepID=A0A9P6HEV3_9AGAM|nr:hypothetical protein BJ322DRAFT_740889 [Thelephora terrestris]